jgi:hypothetical protein
MEIVAVFPGELKEFGGVPRGGFFAQESFETPLDVRTVPGLEAIAARGEPVEF